MTISAVLACRNEEPFIRAWLEEAVAYADEVLIAVHAPTDATADIIARFRADSPVPIVCEWFPAPTTWRFGSSAMKNELIARASGDWITSIDADEEIGPAPDALRAALSLICRVHDCPPLKPAGDRCGYLRRFETDEAGVRAEAARFAVHRDAWFPQVPRRGP